MLKYRLTLPKLAIFFSLIAICVISCGLFVNSTPATQVQEPKPAEVTKAYTTPVAIPASIVFAGEKISLENFDIREALDRGVCVLKFF